MIQRTLWDAPDQPTGRPDGATRGPAEPPDARDLPHAVTFFMTGRERSQILRALRRLDGDRVFALKRALGLA